MKKCVRCKETKLLEMFNREIGQKDGLNSYCKECRRKYDKNRSHSRIDKVAYYESNKEKIKKQINKNKKNKPKQCKAISILNRAVSSGKIKRGVCYVCENKKTDGHHWDYDKPLSVIWLCKSHHKLLHRNFPIFLEEVKSQNKP